VEVRSEERRRWQSVTREQLLGESSPTAERGDGASSSSGERVRGREGAMRSLYGRKRERVREREEAGARACCQGAGHAGATDVHAEGGAGAWRPRGGEALPRSGTCARAGARAGADAGRADLAT
jgi:hypothetical protein